MMVLSDVQTLPCEERKMAKLKCNIRIRDSNKNSRESNVSVKG